MLGQRGFGDHLPETSGPKRGPGWGCRVDIGVAGCGQFRAVRLEPSSYSAGSSWPARRVFKGRGTPRPKSWENRDGCSTGPIRVGGMARSLVWSSEHVGRILLRGAGEEELAPPHWVRRLTPSEHPASVTCFLVWVLGKDRSRSAAPAFCSPPPPPPNRHLPGVCHHVGACSSWGLLFPQLRL